MYLNQSPEEINVPGVQTPINIAPVQTQLTNVLIYLAVAAALLMFYRRR